MGEKITNDVLAERIGNFREFTKSRFEAHEKSIGEVNAHLKTLNGQSRKNTEFRKAQLAINKVKRYIFSAAIALGGIIAGIFIDFMSFFN